MGISGLLPLLKKSSREAHLREFRGQAAAVDAYCWLHKGAFSCADKLVRGEKTDGYVRYMMKQVNQLLSYDIKPILVFDGCNLPSKAGTEAKRRENRERNRKKAKELLREGKIREARECFQRCVDVTSEMAFEVIEACRARDIDIIVAPYEADAQLAFLNLQGFVNLIITEDSDLVLFGCQNIMFKVDSNGGGVLVEHEKLHSSMNLPRDKFTFDKFRNMCILSGCDYLPSLHGIGLAKAAKFFTVTSNPDVYNALCKLPSYLKMPHLEVTQEYREGFLKARNTFLYQLVFDPRTRKLRPLIDYPDNKCAEDFPYAGKFIGHERALQIALGNVNVQSGETTNNFDPDTHKKVAQKSTDWNKKDNLKSYWSIWRSSSEENKPIIKTIGAPNIDGYNVETMKGKQVEVKLPNLKRKRESDIQQQQDNEFSENEFSENDLQNVYGASIKKVKSITPDDLDITPDDLENTLGNLYQEEIDDEAQTNTASPSTKLKSCNPFAKCRSPSKSEVLPARKFSALKRFGQIKKTVIDHNTVVHSRYFSPKTISPDCKPIEEKHSTSENTSLDALSQFLSDDENQESTTPNSQKSPSQLEVKCEKSPFTSEDAHQSESPNSQKSPSQLEVKCETSIFKSENAYQSKSNAKKSFSWDKFSAFSYKKDKPFKMESSPATDFSFKSHSRISENISKSPSKMSCNSLLRNTKSDSESPLESKGTSVIDDNVKENTGEIQEDCKLIAHNSINSSQSSPATIFTFKSLSKKSENISKSPSKMSCNSLLRNTKSNSESPLESKEASVIYDNVKENTGEIQEDHKLNAHNSISSSQNSALSSYSDVGSIDNESFNLSQNSTTSEYFNSQKSAKGISSLNEKFSPKGLGRKPLQSNVKNISQKGVARQPGLSRTTLNKNTKTKQLNLKDMFSKKVAKIKTEENM